MSVLGKPHITHIICLVGGPDAIFRDEARNLMIALIT